MRLRKVRIPYLAGKTGQTSRAQVQRQDFLQPLLAQGSPEAHIQVVLVTQSAHTHGRRDSWDLNEQIPYAHERCKKSRFEVEPGTSAASGTDLF